MRRIVRLGQKLLIYYAVGSLALAILLGEIAFRPERIPVHREAAIALASSNRAAVRDVSIKASDGVRLDAWLLRPGQANSDAVILLHGIGDNREGMLGYAEALLSSGYTVLLPDSRAQGTSGGSFPTYGIQEVDDVRRWIDWLVSEDHAGCVFGFGESMGAAILLQAIKNDSKFCAVVAESPFASFRQIAYIRIGQVFRTGRWLGQVVLRPTVELALLYGRITRGVTLADASPERAVAGSRVPVLLIHGLADQNIPPDQSERIRQANPDLVRLWHVPNAGHCGAMGVAPDQFKEQVRAWYSTHRRL